MSATIKRGDIVRIKPEWRDPGDERFIWRALEDEDGGRVKICATNTGLTFPPNQIVNVSMLEMEQPIHGSPVTDEEMAQENARLLAQHTPGPWRYNWPDIIGGGGIVAEVNTIHQRGVADARLIAAAPELLAALQNILTANPDLAEVADEARAAIAKATGGAQ